MSSSKNKRFDCLHCPCAQPVLDQLSPFRPFSEYGSMGSLICLQPLPVTLIRLLLHPETTGRLCHLGDIRNQEPSKFKYVNAPSRAKRSIHRTCLPNNAFDSLLASFRQAAADTRDSTSIYFIYDSHIVQLAGV